MRRAVMLLFGCYQSVSLAQQPPPVSPSTLTIANPGTVDIGRVPVLLRLDPTRVDYDAVAGAPDTNLRFHEVDSGNNLPFEVVSWNEGGVSEVWIEVDTVAVAAPTEIQMFFGADAQGLADAPHVWDDGYALVEHFGESLADSTGTFGTATLSAGVSLADAQIGSGAKLTGTMGEEITFSTDTGALLDGWDTFTFEFWIYPDYPGDLMMTTPPVFTRGSVDTVALLQSGPTAPMLGFDLAMSDGTRFPISAPIPTQAWTSVALTMNNDHSFRLLYNGIEVVNTPPNTAKLASTTVPFTIGDPATGVSLTGMLDEIRLGMTPHSDSYLVTQYKSAVDDLVKYGP